MMISGLSALLSLIQTFATFIYAQQLAARIPNPKLQGQTRVVMWGIAVCMGMATITIGMVALGRSFVPGPGTPSPTGGGAMIGLGCATGLGSVVFGLWSLLLIDRYRKALGEAAKQARSTWARDLAATANPQA